MDQDLRERLVAMDTHKVFEVMSHYLDRVGHTLQAGRADHAGTPAGAWIEAQLDALRTFGENVPYEKETMADATDVASQWARATEQILAALPKAESDPDLLSVAVTPEEVTDCNTGPVLELLRMLIESPERARGNQGRLDLRIVGYDNHPDELFEIPEVRTYIQQVGRQFPYWLYFCSPATSSLRTITLCHLPPALTDQQKRAQFPIRLHDLLTNRWIPALHEAASFAGYTPDEQRDLSKRAIGYFDEPAHAVVG